MKAFLGFRGLFLLSLMWTCAGDWSAVQVQCSYFWFYVKIKPTIFHNIYMAPDEAFLGDYCAVTRFEPDVFYEFFYHSYDCGIITKILQETLLLKTKIKYISKISNNQAEMPLSCVVHHHNPFFNDVEIRDSDTDSDNGWDIQVKIQAESTGQGGDMVVTSAVYPWENMNVTFPLRPIFDSLSFQGEYKCYISLFIK